MCGNSHSRSDEEFDMVATSGAVCYWCMVGDIHDTGRDVVAAATWATIAANFDQEGRGGLDILHHLRMEVTIPNHPVGTAVVGHYLVPCRLVLTVRRDCNYIFHGHSFRQDTTAHGTLGSRHD